MEKNMFEIKIKEGSEVLLAGRLNAAHTAKLKEVLDTFKEDCIVDFSELTYISSAGLGELIQTYSRLEKSGNTIKLTKMNNHIREVFKVCGLDKVFIIE
jgi:anti-anti-sigma factor